MTVERAAPWVVGFLIAVFFLQAILSMWDDSPTSDEIVAPAVGYAELFTGDFTLVDDHPPLIRILTALPLLSLQPTLPLTHPSWQQKEQGVKDRIDFAYEFFYRVNHNADQLLFWSRLPVVFLSMILGMLVFGWAKKLYGGAAGLFALFLYTLEPNLIAHSRVTTNDLILTLFIFSTLYLFWQYCKVPSRRLLALTGVSLGLALVSKFSAIMLLPMLGLLAVLGLENKASTGNPVTGWTYNVRALVGSIGPAFKTLFIISSVALGVIVLLYGAQWRLFFDGTYNAITHYRGDHPAFLLGRYSTDGWWYYFPTVFLLKTPIPLLICIAVSFFFLSFRKEKAQHLFLLIPIGIIWTAAVLSNLNIGIRHILPMYPFLLVLVSSITTIQFSQPRVFHIGFACLALWYVISTFSVFPSYLAYFNEFVGPKRGYQYLADSNLDWGQDLKRLKGFMDEKGVEHIYLSYFGTADPCYYRLHSIDLPGSFNRCSRANAKPAKFLAVSVTNLQSVYSPDKKTFSWLLPYEPVARIGYSIFVYDIQGDAVAHNNLGILFLRHGQLTKAVEEFKQVAELSPADATAYVNLGFTHARLAAFEEAEQAYEKALQLDPQNPTARAGLQGIKRRKKEIQSL